MRRDQFFMKTNQVYIGFSRPLRKSLRGFVSQIVNALRGKGCVVMFPRSSKGELDAVPGDGLWPRNAIVRCRSALFVFDQNGEEYDAMVQLGHVLAAGVSISCIMVQRSVCASPVPSLLKAYGLPTEEVMGTYFSEYLFRGCLSQKQV